ncbi:hypothetical protein [Paenibacillus hexagrammi]|uniref:DUF3953 domain-containing protein n=1 Tax=Paenibacillus hexagrammi TaxID=2908839 RepID=A0ABY3SPD4_9BACL|nr:hypothetical protein [Paenibacillus sp. YPD9-1]UJF35280.1 hypothetical protein L0M14_09315 [Paenibacillus sp. YPD9-1]
MKILWLFIYSLMCGVLLTLYTNIHDMSKFLFSLGALYAGIRFFRRFEEKAHRIWFIVLSVVIYFMLSLGFALYSYSGSITG